jgi:putative tricarboxylic transport membrane protein
MRPRPCGGHEQRWPELAVARPAAAAAVALLVIADSLRVGIGWADDGPRSGYFPFYIGCCCWLASGWVVRQQLMRWRRTDPCSPSGAAALVLAVLWPMGVYVGLIFGWASTWPRCC